MTFPRLLLPFSSVFLSVTSSGGCPSRPSGSSASSLVACSWPPPHQPIRSLATTLKTCPWSPLSLSVSGTRLGSGCVRLAGRLASDSLEPTSSARATCRRRRAAKRAQEVKAAGRRNKLLELRPTGQQVALARRLADADGLRWPKESRRPAPKVLPKQVRPKNPPTCWRVRRLGRQGSAAAPVSSLAAPTGPPVGRETKPASRIAVVCSVSSRSQIERPLVWLLAGSAHSSPPPSVSFARHFHRPINTSSTSR